MRKVFLGLKESWAECESELWEGADRRIIEPGGVKVVGWLCVGRLLLQPGKRRCAKVTGIKSRRLVNYVTEGLVWLWSELMWP